MILRRERCRLRIFPGQHAKSRTNRNFVAIFVSPKHCIERVLDTVRSMNESRVFAKLSIFPFLWALCVLFERLFLSRPVGLRQRSLCPELVLSLPERDCVTRSLGNWFRDGPIYLCREKKRGPLRPARLARLNVTCQSIKKEYDHSMQNTLGTNHIPCSRVFGCSSRTRRSLVTRKRLCFSSTPLEVSPSASIYHEEKV